MADAPGPETAAKMKAYADQRGLMHYENWSIPQPTQLLQHGFMETVPNVVMGTLPGDIKDAWLAHFDYKTLGRKIGDHYFTVVVARAEASARWASRVLCHDRDLSEYDASNPAEGLELLKMEDRPVKLESDAFAKRFAVWVDHDQDQLQTWEIFDPALIDWLTREAPKDFSFELQDGALACFVPGVLDDAAALDALCSGAARVLARIGEIDGGDDAAADGGEIEAKLAAHPFDKPPSSVRAAARHFGRLPLISGSSWQLGAEAFFRSQAAELGLERLEPSDFLASHIDTVITGQTTQVARGRLPGTELDGYLVFSTLIDDQDSSWYTLLAEIGPEDNGYAFTDLKEADEAEKDGFNVTSDAGSISVFKPAGNPHSRSAKQLRSFLDVAAPLLEHAVAAAKRRP